MGSRLHCKIMKSVCSYGRVQMEVSGECRAQELGVGMGSGDNGKWSDGDCGMVAQ